MARYKVGIDTGTHTGFAVWDVETRSFVQIATMKMHQALLRILELQADIECVYFEDARLRTWYGKLTAKQDRARQQGAGSIKRDCNIWEEFLKDKQIKYMAIAPRNNTTKLKEQAFKNLTGWQGRTSEHARDAAMLVFMRNN